MVWIILLIVILLVGASGVYKKKGEEYSAGRGFFRKSDYDIEENEENKKDFNDYEPWEHKNMRK